MSRPASLAIGQSRVVEVDPRLQHVPTGLFPGPGQAYTFSASVKWKDGFIVCGHEGWGGGGMTRWARVRHEHFFRLCACIGQDDSTAFAVDTVGPWIVPGGAIADDNQLYLFANDLPMMYWNNRSLSPARGGPMQVAITRIA